MSNSFTGMSLIPSPFMHIIEPVLNLRLLGLMCIFLALENRGPSQTLLASDNADNSAYAPQPNHNWPPINGGFGYGPWTPLGGTSGGGTYMAGIGIDNRQVEGNWSFALYGGGGSYAISRPLTNSIVRGTFQILTRFDVDGTGTNLLSLRVGNNASSFRAGELISFGILVDNELSWTDGCGWHGLNSGNALGGVFSWSITFDTSAGTFSGYVTNLAGFFGRSFAGNLQSSAASVGSFAVLNSDPGNGNNFIFDVPVFTNAAGPQVADIGVRVYDGTSTIKITTEPYGTLTSPFRINKNGTNYGVLLVPTTDPKASRIRIQTASGTKAFETLP